MATTIDMSIIWEHLTNGIEAAQTLDIEPEFAAKLKATRAELNPLIVGSRGQLQEWFEDFMETEVHHRHTSHLSGIYSGCQITPETPVFFNAARKSLEIRGNDGTGWSQGWKINFWARFRDGDHAYLLIQKMLRPVDAKAALSYGGGGGVYANLINSKSKKLTAVPYKGQFLDLTRASRITLSLRPM